MKTRVLQREAGYFEPTHSASTSMASGELYTGIHAPLKDEESDRHVASSEEFDTAHREGQPSLHLPD